MKVLVTGGAGFIGGHVCEELLAAGHEVVALDNLSSGRRENVPAGAGLVEMDILDPGLAAFMAQQGFQAVSHHAAQVSVPASVANPVHDSRINLTGLVNLLEASVAGGVERFIYISSGGAIYGESEQLPLAEDHPPEPDSPYAVSKLAGEHYLGYYARRRGLATVSLRYANVYGPRQVPHGEAGVVAIFMDQLLHDQAPVIYRYDDQPAGMLRDYTFVKDCALANRLALERGRGAYNIGTGVPTSTLELWRGICRAAGRDLEPSFGPARLGDVRQSALDCSRARQELGWAPRCDLHEGLAQTWAWRLTE